MKIENKSIYHQHNEIDENIQKNIENQRVRRRNRSILLIVAILVVLSILNILSVGFYKEDLFSVKRHLQIMCGSTVVALIPMTLDYEIYRKPFMKFLLFFGSIGVLLFVIFGPSSIIKSVNGARGWINLGITTIQPAEILKIPFIILLANVLAKGEEKKLPCSYYIYKFSYSFWNFCCSYK